MALSNAQAAKRALYDALRASFGADVGVWHSAPNADHQGNDNMIVVPTDQPMTFVQDWVGNTGRDEQVSIPVRIEVFRGGTDEFEAEDRAWELAAEIASILAARDFDPVIYEARPETGELSTEPFSDGRLARLTVVVHLSGRVYGI